MGHPSSRQAPYEDDRHCFVCGKDNPGGLRLDFHLRSDQVLTASFTPAKTFQGFKDVTHGGILGLLFDEMMVNLPWKLGKKAVSAEFKVRLRKPHPVGEPLDFECRVLRENTRLIFLSATARNRMGRLIAEAEGTCMKVD